MYKKLNEDRVFRHMAREAMMRIRGFIYRLGFRPKPGSMWYSPSLCVVYAWQDVLRSYPHSPPDEGWWI